MISGLHVLSLKTVHFVKHVLPLLLLFFYSKINLSVLKLECLKIIWAGRNGRINFRHKNTLPFTKHSFVKLKELKWRSVTNNQ